MDLQKLQGAIIASEAPDFVLKLFTYAVDLGTSDIHIEPMPNTVRVRIRIDGILQQIIEYPRNFHPAVVSRMKIMGNLKIDEQRIPQDGRISTTTEDNKEIDLRMSTLPTINGEKIVFRIVDKSKKIPTLTSFGIEGHNWEVIQRAIKEPNGIILTSGPTGSGKTTTLYAMMQMISNIKINIITIEDPVEIQMVGLAQSQVYPDIGYTFANGLRTALRQDPDVIMVGEIRDHETIKIAIEAALTGHLVLSTIHTNSAADTINRIIDLGIKNFLIPATANAIIAQRLLRKLCPECKIKYKPDTKTFAYIKSPLEQMHPEELKSRVAQDLLSDIYLYHPSDKTETCTTCGGSGYKGRIGIYEVMEITGVLKELILRSATTDELQAEAIKEGMTTLEQDALIHALRGETSIEEVYRITKHQ